MSFHFGTSETVLFDFWKFSSVGGLVGSMIGIFILAVLYEGLKYYRYILIQTYLQLNLSKYELNVLIFWVSTSTCEEKLCVKKLKNELQDTLISDNIKLYSSLNGLACFYPSIR